MIPKSFAAYHQLHARRARTLLERAARFQDVAAVHDLRVEIKRLRAFHKLIASIAPQPPSRALWRPLRKLFRAAAPLRDFQVQWDLVLQASRDGGGNLSEYLNALKAREIASRAGFRRAAKKFRGSYFDDLYTGARDALGRYRPEKVMSLTSSRLDAALQQMLGIHGDEQPDADTLHRLRILAKEARYVLEILRFQAPPDEWYGHLDRALRALHQTLGRWHDAVVGQQYLTEFLKTKALTPLFQPSAYEQMYLRLETSRARELAAFEHDWSALARAISGQSGIPAPR